jgi:hypothetical protein
MKQRLRNLTLVLTCVLLLGSTGCGGSLAREPSSGSERVHAETLELHRTLAGRLVDTFDSAEELRISNAPVGTAAGMNRQEVRAFSIVLTETANLAADLRDVALPGEPYGIQQGLIGTRDYLRRAQGLFRTVQARLDPRRGSPGVGPLLDDTMDAIREAGTQHDSLAGFLKDPAFDFPLFSAHWPRYIYETDLDRAIEVLRGVLSDDVSVGDPAWTDSWLIAARWSADLTDRAVGALASADATALPDLEARGTVPGATRSGLGSSRGRGCAGDPRRVRYDSRSSPIW